MSVYQDFIDELKNGRNPFMLAQKFERERLPEGNIHIQQKLDGARYGLIFEEGKEPRLVGRNSLKDKGYKYPEIMHDAKVLWETGTLKNVILDGEMIVQGKTNTIANALRVSEYPWLFPDFGALQSREHTENRETIKLLSETTPCTFVVFDYITKGNVLDGDLYGDKLSDRIITIPNTYAKSSYAKNMYEEAQSLGLEGIMIKTDITKYEVGKRSWYWLKWKSQKEADCKVLGYTSHIRAVSAILTDKGKVNAKDHTYDDVILKQEVDTTRYESHPDGDYHWFKEPKLTAVCNYLELTKDGKMRFPVLKEVRE
jgi:ATP-dependent DNA ligase